MRRWILTVFVWALMLITLLSGLNLGQMSALSSPSPSGIAADQTSYALTSPTSSGTIRYHLATEADVNAIEAQLLAESDSQATSPNASGQLTYATGLSSPTSTELRSLVGQIAIFDGYVSASSSSPSTYDISTQAYFPKVTSQGTEGACAAFSTIYYNYGYLEALDNGWTDASLGNPEHLMSPSWTYNKVVFGVGTSDVGGSVVEHNALVAKTMGVSTLAEMPFVDGDHSSWGSETAWRNAPLHRLDNIIYYTYSAATTVSDLKQSLASDHPVTIAIDATPINGYQTAFADGNKYVSAAEYSSAGTDHAVTIVGYNDTMTDGIHTDVGYFKIVNSWGSAWGDHGYFWMSYDTIKEIGGLLQAISMTDKIDYQPAYLAVYHFDDAPSVDSTITISAVRSSDGTVMAEVIPEYITNVLDPDYLISTFMVQDITEMSAYVKDTAYSIRLDVSSAAEYGSVSSYRLEQCSDPYVVGKAIAIGSEASGLPMQTPCDVLATMQDVPAVTATDALSYFDAALTFSGDAQWVGASNTQGRAHVMQSGDVGDSASSTLTAVVQGPGTFGYEWKVSSESGYDYLNVSLDGAQKGSIDGETAWSSGTVDVPSGLHFISWNYSKDVGVSVNGDCGWVDNFTWNGRTNLLFEDFEPDSTGVWHATDGNALNGTDTWEVSTLRPLTGTYSIWCAENGTGPNGLPNHLNDRYDRNMIAWTYTMLPDLTGVSTADLSFEYWAHTSTNDFAYVEVYNGSSWSRAWTQPAPDSDGWQPVGLNIPAGTTAVMLGFVSGSGAVGVHEGVFFDDVLLTGSADTAAPDSSIAPLPALTRTAIANLTVSVDDHGGSGVAYFQVYYGRNAAGPYSLYTTAPNPSGEWNTGTVCVDLNLLGLGDGLYNFYSIATDRSGNREDAPGVPQAVTVLDRTPPVTTGSTSGVASPGWNPGPVTVTLSSSDPGLHDTTYRIGNGVWVKYSAPFTVSTVGGTAVQYYSSDTAGNIEGTKTLTVKIDEQAPVTTATLAGTMGNSPWYVGEVTVNLTAADALSGTRMMQYRLNGGDWLTYSGNFTMSEEGNCSLEYFATDRAGNAEPTRQTAIKVDLSMPTSTCTLNGQHVEGTYYFRGNMTVSLSTYDTVSGAGPCQYSLDGGAWTTFTGALGVTSEAAHNLRFGKCADGAGNVEGVSSLNFTIDRTAPIGGLSMIGTMGTNGWYNTTVYAIWQPSDALSGVLAVHYRLDGGAWLIATGSVMISADGNHSLEHYTTDIAGNAEEPRTVAFRIDTGMPSAVIHLEPGQKIESSTMTVAMSIGDNCSGLSSVLYRLDNDTYGSTETDRIVLTGLADGTHTLTVRITDQAGNVVVRNVEFTVTLPNDRPSELPGLPLIILLIAAIIFSAAFLVIRRKRKV